MSIQDRYILATVTTGIIGQSRKDKGATASVASQYGVTGDDIRATKSLYRPEVLKPIKEIQRAFRGRHDQMTTCWDGKRTGLLANSLYEDYKADYLSEKSRHDYLADKLANEFSQVLSDEAKRLGPLFDAGDYPTPDQVRAACVFRVDFDPVPDSGDCRIDIPEQDLKDLRAAIERSNARRVADAMSEVHDRVIDRVGHMRDKLSAYQPATDTDKAVGIFRDSLVEHVRELSGILDAINVTQDPTLAEVAADMRRDLIKHSAEDLREDPDLRSEVAENATKILAKLKSPVAPNHSGVIV